MVKEENQNLIMEYLKKNKKINKLELLFCVLQIFFNYRLYWIDSMVIKSLRISGLDIKSYVNIYGVIKVFVYKVNLFYIVCFYKF